MFCIVFKSFFTLCYFMVIVQYLQMCICSCGCVSCSVEFGDGLEGRPFFLFLGSSGSVLFFEEKGQQGH